jgi:hypothetical protein
MYHNCGCGSQYTIKNKNQHFATNKHRNWIKAQDDIYQNRLEKELEKMQSSQKIVSSNTIMMEEDKPIINDLEQRGDTPRHPVDEDKKKGVSEATLIGAEGDSALARKQINVNIHCVRCTELRLALEMMGIVMGITAFGLILWKISK